MVLPPQDEFFYSPRWPKPITLDLIAFLITQKNLGNWIWSSNNGQHLNSKFNWDYTDGEVLGRVKHLRARISLFEHLIATSGVAWDRDLNFVIAPIELWIQWRELYPMSRAYMVFGEPLYDELKLMFSPPDQLLDPNLVIVPNSESDDDQPFEPMENQFAEHANVIIIPDSESDDDIPLEPLENPFHVVEPIIPLEPLEDPFIWAEPIMNPELLENPNHGVADGIIDISSDDEEWLNLLMEYEGDESDLDIDISDGGDTDQPKSEVDDDVEVVDLSHEDEVVSTLVKAPTDSSMQNLSFANVIPTYTPPHPTLNGPVEPDSDGDSNTSSTPASPLAGS